MTFPVHVPSVPNVLKPLRTLHVLTAVVRAILGFIQPIPTHHVQLERLATPTVKQTMIVQMQLAIVNVVMVSFSVADDSSG